MELLEFIKTLKRYKLTLILVPVITIIAAYFFISKMPDNYKARTQMSTGIVDRSQKLLNSNGWNNDIRTEEEFANLTQMMMLNKITDQVSYQLMLHDLKSPYPFREVKNDYYGLSKETLAAQLEQKYASKAELNLSDKEDKAIYNALKSVGYDHETLKKGLNAFRMSNSDFVEMEYESEHPELSAFVLNTLAHEFTHYYTTVVTENKKRTVVYLDSLLREKQITLLGHMEALKNYKINNRLLDIEEQASSYYSRISDLATQKGMAEKDVVAYNAALREINGRFNPKNRAYLESEVSSVNQDIVRTQEELKSLNEAYVKSDFDPRYKAKMDSVQSKLTAHIYDQSDRHATSPLAAKENLVNQKLTLEVSRDLAKNSLSTLNSELGKLNSGLERMVPSVAQVQAMEAKIEVANKEYQDILARYNQASLEASYALPLRQAQQALPGTAEPSKKMLLVAFSGVTSLIFCVMVLFVMFYFDKSVHSADQLKNVTHLPVIGSLNLIEGSIHEVQYLWGPKPLDPDKQYYKNLLRNIRFEVEKNLGSDKVIAVTSLQPGAGKTFLTTSLAYAFSKINKKVLIIDGNFLNPDISNTIKNPKYLETLLQSSDHRSENRSISVMGNKGGDCSLLELSSQESIEKIFDELRSHYDIIIIETGALESINKAKAKEWIMFADRVIAVYPAGEGVHPTMGQEIQYLSSLDDKFGGFILNKVPAIEHSNVVSLKSRAQAYGLRAIKNISTIKTKLKPSA